MKIILKKEHTQKLVNILMPELIRIAKEKESAKNGENRIVQKGA